MAENPYEPPSKEIESLPMPSSPQGWTWQRLLFVVGLSPFSAAVWIAACVALGATMKALNWPLLSVRQRIGIELALVLIAVVGAIPAVAFQVAILRLSRCLGRKRDMLS
jgi:hypothetical protein